jgi:tRNA A-37 threonylcarbamoyl transferase component Bud32
LEGRTLGKYQVLELLGRGGQARVYRGYHPGLDRPVAIKVLRADLLDEPLLARFRREARAVAALRHPNVVQVFDFDVEDERYYIVMELLTGDTLQARLAAHRARGRRVPPGEGVRILLDVLDGLAYAHGRGVVHRDIKPGNVLLTGGGQAVLGDFGIARIVGGTRYTGSGAWVGTLDYMAPEQGLRGESDARSDLYSLGVVLYEMLTGRPPFEAETPLAVLMCHVNDPVPSPRELDLTVPAPLARVALRALAKDPEARYQSAEEMAQALRAAAAEAGVTLPARVSSASPEVPGEPGAVLSGAERGAVAAPLAAGETEAVGWAPALRDRAAGALRRALDALAGDLRTLPAASRAIARDLTPPEAVRARRRRYRPAAYAVAVWAAVNALVLSLVALTGWKDVVRIAWPVEFFLVAGVVCSVAAVDWPWLLGAAGFLAGNGLLFFYSSATGYWRHWIFLSVLDLGLLVVCAGLTVWLVRHEVHARRLGRALGRPLALACFLAGLAGLGLSVVLSLWALLV